MPRHSVMLLQASLMVFVLSSSTSILRCPSILVMGSTTIRFAMAHLLGLLFVVGGFVFFVRAAVTQRAEQAVRGNTCRRHRRQHDADVVDGLLPATDCSRLDGFLQGRHGVPEPDFRAADAAMPCHDGPGNAVIEAQVGTVAEGVRALAADLVEAPSLPGALVAPLVDKLTGVV